ncbi:unnamed protein product [Xylocopa violacea]|uniref:MYND-type domain-containing protein n=1 Tax=Xylocopa violacea TaxID=135666 RepID=A0ABP1PH40_XYLVO
MEETEAGFYRTLCSLETLRSGTKGFFREFSEKVTGIAGEQWISKVFGRLSGDEDRVRAVFVDGKIKDAVLDTLNRTEILYRGKDASVSRARRLEGFEAAAAGERRKALALFSQAVLRAPLVSGTRPIGDAIDAIDRGFGLPLAFLARAQMFLASNRCAFAERDLSFVEETDHLPDALRAELVRAKETCEKRRSEGTMVAKAEERRESLVSGEQLLEIEETENAGKRAIATKRIEPGQRVITEPPLAAVLLPEYFGTHCHHCFRRFEAPIGCPVCSSVAFCDRECRDAAIDSYHKYECKILALLIGSGMSILSMLALRMVTQNGPSECLKISRALNRRDESTTTTTTTTEKEGRPASKSAKRRTRKKKLREGSSCDLRAYDLVMHEKRRTAKDFFERSLMAAFLLRCLQRVGFFRQASEDNEPPSDEEIAVASLVLKHLQLLQFNAHEVFETRLGTEHRFRGSKPVYIGVAVYPTVARFNHDCYPAVARATRPLQPGDAIAENYGPIFTKRTLEDRRRALAGRYWFRCECTACRENWPRFDGLTNEAVRLRCPSEGCPRLHRRPRDPDKTVECSSCRRSINLRASVERVLECERLYARGFAAMDREQPETALEAFHEAAREFHRVAVPPHRDTHLAEIAASACMADRGNVYQPVAALPLPNFCERSL